MPCHLTRGMSLGIKLCAASREISYLNAEVLKSAFYRLSNGALSKEISIRDWVNFWFKGPERYKEPLPRSPKQPAKPKSNHSPNGYIDMSFLPRMEEENVPFVELGVEVSLREKTNLAFFLACWICKFVLPIKKLDHICPSVFKIASLMAHGERFALPIPILASIYRGLTEITTSANIGTGDIIFPIQYVYGWIGAYFNFYYQARHYNGARMCRITGERMVRSFDLSGARRLRSSNVTLRCDDHFVMEPYSPHRFSRQFGFVQDLPGIFSKRPYDDTLEELVRLWDFCTRLSSSSTISIPPHPERPLTTNRYANWWYIGRPNLVGQNKIILKVSLHPSEQGNSSTSSLIKSKTSPLCSKLSPSREALRNNMEVVDAQAKSPKVHAPSLCLSSFVAPNFEPQEMISTFKKSYIL
ncbi:hypothetical protein FXO38_32603 [Capsicum annuum]|nr:hypothetical protein FXO38_32603 [Capsicum annuum]